MLEVGDSGEFCMSSKKICMQLLIPNMLNADEKEDNVNLASL